MWCGRGPNSECDEVRETDRQKETRTRAKETNERERLRRERRESGRERREKIEGEREREKHHCHTNHNNDWYVWNYRDLRLGTRAWPLLPGLWPP